VPALPTGPKPLTVPSSAAIDTALPGISAPLHYEAVPYTESVPQTVPAPSTTEFYSIHCTTACIH